MEVTLTESKRQLLSNVLYYIFFIAMCLIVFIPVLLVVFGSLKTNAELGATSPFSLPSNFLHFENFVKAFNEGHILLGLRNTFVLVVVSMAGNALLGTMTAFVLNRFDFKMKKMVLLLFMVSMIIPLNLFYLR